MWIIFGIVIFCFIMIFGMIRHIISTYEDADSYKAEYK